MDNINLSRNRMVMITKEIRAVTWLLINKTNQNNSKKTYKLWDYMNSTVETYSIILLLLTSLFSLSQFQNVATQIDTKM